MEKMTISKAVRCGASFLKESNIDNADYDSFALLADIMGIDRSYYYMHGDDELDSQVYNEFLGKVRRRCAHEPLQHITGKQYFYGNEFKVNPDVLIPRQDTEVLVSEALKILDDKMSVLDMCTGSGCIIISLALNKNLNEAVGVDLSAKALKVADENAANLGASDVNFIESNLFESLDLSMENKFDMIVSNPPYIETDVIRTLSDEVKLHDPMMALDGHEDGLYFYRKITSCAPKFLKNGGWLLYEIGYNQADAVSVIMRDAGFRDVSTVKDLAGLDRVVAGRFN